MFEFVVRGIPFCSIVFTVTSHEHHGVTSQRLIYCSKACPCQQQTKYPNSLTGNVIFVINHFWMYEITHADVGAVSEVVFCSIASTVMPHERHGVPKCPTTWQCAQQNVLASIVITVTQSEHHDVSNSQPLDCLFNITSALSHWRGNNLQQRNRMW